MKEQILEIAEKLRLELITTDEARDLLLCLFIVSVNGVPYNIQDVMLYYDKSKFVFNSSITNPMQRTKTLQVRITADIQHYLDVIEQKYHFKRCDFVRLAILEKMQRDVPKLRKDYINRDFPF
jgi:hypothetical protein